MPAIQRGQVDQIGPKRFRLRWYDRDGKRHAKQPFASRSTAWSWYRDHVEPQLLGGAVPLPDLTLGEFVPLYLERHAGDVRPRTIKTLRERLGHAVKRFGNVPLRELERMADEVAAWRSNQPSGVAYGRMGALRQCLAAAVRWGYMSRNPAVDAGKNRQPPPRTIRVFTFDELDTIAAELSPEYQPLPMFAAATGLRPEEWQALERRDIDRRAGVLNVRRTVSSDEVVELGKTSRSRRQVPLSKRALAAVDALPPRLDTPLVFPAPGGGLLNTNNFRNREWAPAVEAAGMQLPARLYDLRSTFASNALAAGVSVFELARVMGTSVHMIERHYGTLLEGATAGIARRLDAFEDERDRVAADHAHGV
jgi:integrase